MKRYAAFVGLLGLLSACDGGEDLSGEYLCTDPDGGFGSKLTFDGKGSLLLDFVTEEQVARSPDLGRKNNVPGSYELRDDLVILSYFDGAQKHTLKKKGEAFESSTPTFASCTKQP